MNQESVQSSAPSFNGVSPSPAPAAPPVDELAFGLLMNRTLRRLSQPSPKRQERQRCSGRHGPRTGSEPCKDE